jgi:hypothetical protein
VTRVQALRDAWQRAERKRADCLERTDVFTSTAIADYLRLVAAARAAREAYEEALQAGGEDPDSPGVEVSSR